MDKSFEDSQDNKLSFIINQTNNEINNKVVGIGNQTTLNTGKKSKIKNNQTGVLGEILHFFKSLICK
jgi:hypothetical protein